MNSMLLSRRNAASGCSSNDDPSPSSWLNSPIIGCDKESCDTKKVMQCQRLHRSHFMLIIFLIALFNRYICSGIRYAVLQPCGDSTEPVLRFLKVRRSCYFGNLLLNKKRFSVIVEKESRGESTDTIDSSSSTPRSFPKWGSSTEEENTLGLSFQPILDFLLSSSAYIRDGGNNSIGTNSSITPPSYHPIIDYAWTETLYAIEPGGTLWISQLHRDVQNISEKPKVERRFNNTERLMVTALDDLKQDYQQSQQSCTKSQWPNLCHAIFPSLENTSGGNGVPFFSWYGDYDSCDFHNWNSSKTGNAVSVPLFTVAARLDCNYTFPFPNYYSHLMSSAEEWDQLMDVYRQRYPWATKTPLAAWRGSLTGSIRDATDKCPRWKMVQTVREIEDRRNETSQSPLFDVAINSLPPRAQHFLRNIQADVGRTHLRNDHLDFIDFQKYRAILDIDGNSWSGRFGSLLCFNSVVLKVEPTYVDYFYSKVDNPHLRNTTLDDTLQPWKHYIPVKGDLSDLEERAQYALDPQNEAEILEIIQNANDWCRVSLLEQSFAVDMLNIWERYVKLLNINDPKWNSVAWKLAKSQVFDASSPFVMIELSRDEYQSREAVVKMVPTSLDAAL